MENDEDPFINSKNLRALEKLRKSENGRIIAKNLFNKFSALSENYRQLDASEKSRVVDDLKEKIKLSLEGLTKTLSNNDDDDDDDDNVTGGFLNDDSSNVFSGFWCLLCVLIILGE